MADETLGTNGQDRQVTLQGEVRAPRPVTPVSDVVPLFDTAKFEHFQRIATVMGNSSLLPEHFYGDKDAHPADRRATAIANAFLTVSKAYTWGMEPFELAQGTYSLHGRIGHEGKVIQAMLERRLGSRFGFRFSGEGSRLSVEVFNRHPIDGEMVVTHGNFAMWHTTQKDNKTVSPAWAKDPVKMMRYRGVREWGREHAPGYVLGVYSVDELEEMRDDYRARSATPIPSAPSIPSPPATVAEEVPKSEERQPAQAQPQDEWGVEKIASVQESFYARLEAAGDDSDLDEIAEVLATADYPRALERELEGALENARKFMAQRQREADDSDE